MGSSLLFDLDNDSLEAHNLIDEKPELSARFAEATERTDFAGMERIFSEHERNCAWFKRYEEQVGLEDAERRKDNPAAARGALAIKAVYRLKPPKQRQKSAR